MTRRPIRSSFVEAFPDLAAEVVALLERAGHAGLAEQLPELSVLERCRCGDDSCATIEMTVGAELGAASVRETIPLDPETGMISVDVVDGRIVTIEVLFRDDVRKTLLEFLP